MKTSKYLIMGLLVAAIIITITACQTATDPKTGFQEAALSPAGSNALATAGAIIQAGKEVPGPTQPLFGAAEIAYTGVTALIALYLREKNKKLRAAALAAATAIEDHPDAEKLKVAAKEASIMNGSENTLHSLVRNL